MDLTAIIELRVHGVGGPQGPKMLGYPNECDVVTEGRFTSAGGDPVPADRDSRFLRPVVDDAARPLEAYEWGGLTTGSLWKSMWVVFLPFTVLNVAGWARATSGAPGRSRAWRDGGARLLAYLGTISYILWSAYLLLELIAFQWRAHLDDGSGSVTAWLGAHAVAPAAVAALLVFLGALWMANSASGRAFEGANPDRMPGQLPEHWDDAETAVHPDFFAHQRSRDRLRSKHVLVAVATACVALAFAWAGVGHGRSRIGLTIVVVATIQVVALALVWVFAFVQRGSRLYRATLLTLGTVMCHAFFAGTGLWLRDRLATIPATERPTPLRVGAELALSDQFAIALGLAVVAVVLTAAWPGADSTASGFIPRAARRAPMLGVVVALAFLATFGQFSVRQVIGPDWSCAAVGGQPPETSLRAELSCWYDAYPVGQTSAFQELGAKALLALPVVIALCLRSKTAAAHVLGNVWDVFTFWPRRYHPFAVPPYSERAVPELRARIRAQVSGGGGVILSGHSQGSVLCLAAVATEIDPDQQTRVHLILYGSPLGTLLCPVFYAAVGPEVVGGVRTRLESAHGRWWVFWRKTDPIGGPLFGPTYPDEHELTDPPPGTGWAPPRDLASRAPLDRPPRWGVTRGHGFYTAEREYRAAVDEARQALTRPSDGVI